MCSEAARPVTALMITNNVDEAILLSDRILALGRGPAASLSPAVPVDLAKPRAADLLFHDEKAIRIRSRLAEFLTAGSQSRPSAVRAAARGVAKTIPVEA